MAFRDLLKKVVRGLGMEEKADQMEQMDKLKSYQAKLDNALSNHGSFIEKVAVCNALYNGTKKVLPNKSQVYVSSRFDNDTGQTEDARQVVNIIFELIESQIDVSVPKPAVDPIEEDDFEYKKRMVEGMLTYMSEGPELERIVSENERITKKNGMSVMKVIFDPNHKSHRFRGKIKVTNPHPVNIIPQPGVYRVQDMDYIFHIETRTIDYICRTYGEEFREELEQSNAAYKYLESLDENTNHAYAPNEVSVVECWYRDKDGDIGLFVWADETILKDIPKYYYRRDADGNPITKEIVRIEDPDTGEVTDVEVDAYIPTKLPFVIQYNIPQEKQFAGKADPEVIRDQQESIKKMLSMEEARHVLGTTKIITRKGTGLKNKINNAVTQILETDDPMSDVRVIDMKTSDNSLVERYQLLRQAAKDALGVTDASQGKLERSNISGRAIEQLTQNSLGRMSTKTHEKKLAFTELYQLFFDFILAFYDEPRPWRTEGTDNKPQFGYFDRSKMLKRDDAGTWYYPEFDIYINAETGWRKDKTAIMETAREALQYGAITPVGYWTIMEGLGYPNSGKMLEIAQLMEGNPAQDILSLLNEMSPEAREMFLNKPIEEQLALIDDVLQGGEVDG